MAGTITKVKKLINPGNRRKRRRKMSAKQIAIFGTKRQKAALRNGRKRRRRNISGILRVGNGRRSRRRNAAPKGWPSYLGSYYKMIGRKGGRTTARKRKRKKNISLGVGEIKSLLGFGRKRRTKKRRTNLMARTRRRARIGNRRHHRRHRRSNPKVVVRYRYRKANAHRRHRRRRNVHYVRRVARNKYMNRNPGRRRSYRRHRNPGMLSGTAGKVAGYLGGFALTAMLDGMLPSFIPTSGLLGLLTTGVVAYGQGKVIGKITRNATFGNDMVIGGLAYLALKAIRYFVPSLSLPGFSGMGLIGGSQFYVPQVPTMGNYGTFVPVGAMAGAPVVSAGSGMHGMGRVARGPRRVA